MPRVVAVWHRWCSGRRRCSGRRAACPPARRRAPCCCCVAPLVFRAPSGPAAREIATRELRSEWSISKPARALRTLRRPPHRRRLSLIGGSVLCLETRPDLAFAPQASSPALAHIAAESTPNVARNSPATLSNIEFRSLELQRFLTLLELYPIELRATFLGVCLTVGDVAGGSFLVFCWFLLVRNVARLLLWSCVWLVFGEDLGLLVERNVALVWVCGVCCERKFAPAW